MGTSHKEMVAEIKPGRNVETIACREMEEHPEEEKTASVDTKPEAAEQQEEVPVEDATVIPVGESEEETSNTRKETMACQEMEECLEEEKPTSVDRKPEVAQQREVPVEDAVVKPVNGRKRRHRGKRQSAGRREEPKKLTRGDCGSRMKLATARRKVPRRATVAWRKRIIFRKTSTQRNCGPRKEVTAAGIKFTRCAGYRDISRNKDNVTPRSPKGVTFGKRLWKGPECNTGIRDRSLKQRLRIGSQLKDLTKNAIKGCRLGQRSHLRRRGPLKVISYEIIGRKITKRIVGYSERLRQDKDWTLWRGRPPPKRKKKNGKQVTGIYFNRRS
jgi:hypothetical protein